MVTWRILWLGLTLLIILASGLTACDQPEGEKLLREQCTSCHKKSEVVAEGRTREDWSQVVN